MVGSSAFCWGHSRTDGIPLLHPISRVDTCYNAHGICINEFGNTADILMIVRVFLSVIMNLTDSLYQWMSCTQPTLTQFAGKYSSLSEIFHVFNQLWESWWECGFTFMHIFCAVYLPLICLQDNKRQWHNIKTICIRSSDVISQIKN